MEFAFPSALPPGTELGRYKLLKAVGQGGFGITYAAWDKELDRRVAIKECVLEGLCYRDKESGRLVPISEAAAEYYDHALLDMHREVRTLASLNHERIIPVYDVFLSQDGLFYAMPWLDGGTLAERLPSAKQGEGGRSAPDVETVCRWLQQLLEGLTYLHGKGVIHRDIKPANILFNERDEPVIIDFGAALNRSERTTTSSQGEFSVAYGAPEQITGKGHVGPWTDFYSLAAVFYELIAGVRPESADKRLMDDSLLDLPGFPQAKGYPEAVLSAIMRNLSLPPALRCQSSTEWRHLLDPASLLPHRKGVSRRTLFLVAAGAFLLAGALAGTVFPLSAPAQEGVVLTEAEMEQRVRAHYHIEDWEARCRAFQENDIASFLQARKAAYQAEADRINALPLAADRTLEVMRAENGLIEEWDGKLNALTDRYLQLLAEIPAREYLVDHYPAATQAEISLLPGACDRVVQACVNFHTKGASSMRPAPAFSSMLHRKSD